MKTKGMRHQIEYLDASEGKRNFACFGEQGTGKSWMTLADIERCFIGNKIDALLIWAPKGVHTNWILREVPKHLEVASVGFAWTGPVKTKKQKDGIARLYQTTERLGKPTLRIFAINFEAMLQPAAREMVDEFIATYRVMAVVDESKKIGNPDAKRTKYIIAAGRAAEARRILSGKPLTKAPMDLFSQFDFLKEGLLGTKSYRAFVSEYAVLLDMTHPRCQGMLRKMGPRGVFAQIVEVDEVTGKKKYRNLDRLVGMLRPHMYRITKAECLDLPPKVYAQRRFDLSDEARAVYDRLESEYEYVSKQDGPLSFQAIAARAKMKQVTAGFINVYGEPEIIDAEKNPRMETLLDIIDDMDEDHSFIIWAVYREEIRQIVAQLAELGISTVEYHGGVKEDDRDKAIDDFQAGKARAFVCNKAAYAGITLTRALHSIYYSCDFDNDVRSQSEDRNHRIGTTGTVTYWDIIANGTIDEDVVANLEEKNRIADYVIDGVGVAP